MCLHGLRITMRSFCLFGCLFVCLFVFPSFHVLSTHISFIFTQTVFTWLRYAVYSSVHLHDVTARCSRYILAYYIDLLISRVPISAVSRTSH